jgi:hypothetical protein
MTVVLEPAVNCVVNGVTGMGHWRACANTPVAKAVFTGGEETVFIGVEETVRVSKEPVSIFPVGVACSDVVP